MFVYAPPNRLPVFGASLATLNDDYPNTDFPPFMTVAEKVQFNLYPVTATEPPPIDPATQKVAPADPPAVLVDGAWQQAWEVVPLTDEEIKANNPPRWSEFAFAIAGDPAVNAWLDAVPKGFYGLLIGAMTRARTGESEDLIEALNQAKIAGPLPPPVAEVFRSQAIANRLPDAVVDAL